MAKVRKAAEKKPKGTRLILPIIICSVLAAVLLFGIVMGSIALARELGAVVSYGGVTVDRGVASYLASTYKAQGGEADGEAIERYIRSVVAAAYLFDRNASLSDTDREWIKTNTAEILDYKAGNSKAEFNKLAADMGFSYDDFVRATELIYKAAVAKEAIYGVGGARLAYSQNSSLVSKYYAKYSHVKIIFIRTEDRFLLDEDGNRVKDEDGNDKLVDLSDYECELVREDIEEIRELMEGANTGGEVQMSLETFNSYYKTYNDDPQNADNGYYFAPASAYTAEYMEEYPNLIAKALSMSVGEYALTEDGDTVCAIYKYGNVLHDYVSSSASHFFTDFYSDAADFLFAEALDELIADVKVKDSYYAIDVAALKKNNLFKTTIGIGLRGV
ncbi:MAG: hypothetical protein IKC32_00595 [Clostridia bacterium]|nr:hypothetical protein [Clostridia bacterium]